MLQFASASTRMANSRRAMTECLEAALGVGDTDCDLLVINAAMGHDMAALLKSAAQLAPSAAIVGSSCCGVVGREGVSESMNDVAIMAVRGGEFAVAHVDGIHGENSDSRCAVLAQALLAAQPGVNMVSFLASGIDIANDHCIAGFESVLGPDVTVFGATSADNMKGITSYQLVGGTLADPALVMEHGAWAIGFADPTLSVVTQATHGFVAVGDPLVVTGVTGNRIHTLDGMPAWQAYTARLALPASATCGDTIPIGALAEVLPADLAVDYGSPHILRVVTRRDDDGTMHYPTTVAEGTSLWLTVRDEELIFSAMDKMMAEMVVRIDGRPAVAVFHADCLARGRYLFHRVMKEELVGRMQYPLSSQGVVPPWLGMYGFGEFARLGGANTYHNYTTAIAAIVRG